MSKINVYLHFNGNCAEAMHFYKECLGGRLTITTIAESPMAKEWPEHMQQHILHASLIDNDMVLLASDMGGPAEMEDGNSISLSLNCNTMEQTRKFYTNLSNGGKTTRPLHEFFNGTIGALTDKYGKQWVLYCEKK
jgi:PhnB protein